MFAAEGSWFIISAAVIPVVAFIAAIILKQPLWYVVAAIGLLLTGFMLFFFRDPEINEPAQDTFVSPTDGNVLKVVEKEDGSSKIVIFLSLFNVHALRSPAAGKVTETFHMPGKFHPAYKDIAGVENEHVRVDLETAQGRISFYAMSGLVARRIVSHARNGDILRAGQRIGFIRFGSRSEIDLPAGFDVQIKKGDKVKAGSTIIAVPVQDTSTEVDSLESDKLDSFLHNGLLEVSGA